jgi:hypothetical protein
MKVLPMEELPMEELPMEELPMEELPRVSVLEDLVFAAVDFFMVGVAGMGGLDLARMWNAEPTGPAFIHSSG